MTRFTTCIIAALGLATTAVACTTEDDTGSTEQGAIVEASADVESRFGVTEYMVEPRAVFPDGSERLVVHARAGASEVAELDRWRDTSTREAVLRITMQGSVIDMHRTPEELSIIEDGVLVATIDLAEANDQNPDDLTISVSANVERAVALANAVLLDRPLLDHLGIDGESPFLIADCPWWVTLGSCAAWETGAGAVVCVACGLSYLL